MAKSRVMSRQDFLTSIEKLLGRFESDSFMRGFQAGQQNVVQRIRDWVQGFPQDHDYQKPISMALKAAKVKSR